MLEEMTPELAECQRRGSRSCPDFGEDGAGVHSPECRGECRSRDRGKGGRAACRGDEPSAAVDQRAAARGGLGESRTREPGLLSSTGI